MITSYEHHGTIVKVDEKLKGTHREHCLCWQNCKLFTPENRETNCEIANKIYENCVKFHVTTPVFECPKFEN